MKQKKLFSLLMISVMFIIMLTSCTSPGIAAKTPTLTIPAGIFSLIVNDVFTKVSEHEDFDTTLTNVLDNNIEDQKIKDWVDNEAEERLNQFIAVEKLFEELELSLSEETESDIQAGVDAAWDDQASEYERRGISKNSLHWFEQNVSKHTEIFNAYYEEGGIEEVDNETLKGIFAEQYIAYRLIIFPLTDSLTNEPLSEDDQAAVKVEADAFFERAKNGEEFTDLIDEFAKKADPESTSKSAEDAPAILNKQEASEGVSQDMAEQAKIDTPLLLTDDTAHYLIMPLDPLADEQAFLDFRSTVLNSFKEEDFLTMLNEKAAQSDITLQQSTLNQFSFKNLVNKEKI